MARFELISEEEAREIFGGAKVYSCPWNDYRSTNFWKTYSHSIGCAYRHKLFDLPISFISRAIKIHYTR